MKVPGTMGALCQPETCANSTQPGDARLLQFMVNAKEEMKMLRLHCPSSGHSDHPGCCPPSPLAGMSSTTCSPPAGCADPKL